MRAFLIIEMASGRSNFDPATYAFEGFVHIGQPIGGYGAYLLSGKQSELTQLDNLPKVCTIVVFNDNTKEEELGNTLPASRRNKLNTLLTSLGLQTVPAGMTAGTALEHLVWRS
jgi:hypothetical protein